MVDWVGLMFCRPWNYTAMYLNCEVYLRSPFENFM